MDTVAPSSAPLYLQLQQTIITDPITPRRKEIDKPSHRLVTGTGCYIFHGRPSYGLCLHCHLMSERQHSTL
jgi:hypothetical protein